MEKEGIVFAMLSVVTVLVIMWFLSGVMMSMGTENINYVLLDELDDGVEIRQYDDLTLVSTSADDTSSAFSTLARYISGSNEGNVRIEMTAPVLSHREESTVNVSFVLPERYDVSNAPEPGNKDIAISSLSSRKLATITFSGYVSDDSYEEHRSRLESVLRENDISTRGRYFLMRYNPPWVPPTLMRNEVAVEVE